MALRYGVGAFVLGSDEAATIERFTARSFRPRVSWSLPSGTSSAEAAHHGRRPSPQACLAGSQPVVSPSSRASSLVI